MRWKIGVENRPLFKKHVGAAVMGETTAERALDTFSDGNLHFDFVERLFIYDLRPASLRNRIELTREKPPCSLY